MNAVPAPAVPLLDVQSVCQAFRKPDGDHGWSLPLIGGPPEQH